MSDLELWSAIVGFFMPLGIALINQNHWAPALKGLVAFLLCLVAAAVEVWIRGDLSTGTWVHAALVVVFAAIGSYTFLWRPSTIAPQIEAATSTR